MTMLIPMTMITLITITFDNNDTNKYDNSDEYDNTDSSANSKVVRFELEIFFFLNVYNWAIQHF